MAEVGNMPLPLKLLRKGVTDMVRISDARMSGTAFGTIILHVSPESAKGGPLGLIRTGDEIRLSVRERRIDAMVSEPDLENRRREIRPVRGAAHGYAKLYADSVLGPGAQLRF